MGESAPVSGAAQELAATFSRQDETGEAGGFAAVNGAHPDVEAKLWLDPAIELAVVVGLSAHQLREAQQIVTRHELEVRDAWVRHFGR